MVYRITVYGWVIDDHYGPYQRGYALVDLVYFCDEDVTAGDIRDIIVQSGYKFLPYRYQGRVVQDKVTIEQMNIGIERIEEEGQITGYERQAPF